jgi:hypothetical protein
VIPSGQAIRLQTWWIWMRLPQVSSNTATVTGPAFVGAMLNATPSFFSRSCSF